MTTKALTPDATGHGHFCETRSYKAPQTSRFAVVLGQVITNFERIITTERRISRHRRFVTAIVAAAPQTQICRCLNFECRHCCSATFGYNPSSRNGHVITANSQPIPPWFSTRKKASFRSTDTCHRGDGILKRHYARLKGRLVQVKSKYGLVVWAVGDSYWVDEQGGKDLSIPVPNRSSPILPPALTSVLLFLAASCGLNPIIDDCRPKACSMPGRLSGISGNKNFKRCRLSSSGTTEERVIRQCRSSMCDKTKNIPFTNRPSKPEQALILGISQMAALRGKEHGSARQLPRSGKSATKQVKFLTLLRRWAMADRKLPDERSKNRHSDSVE